MGNIAIFEIDKTSGMLEEVINDLDTTDEAIKWLRINGADKSTYQTAQLGKRMKCEKVTRMQLIEVRKEVKKDA